jgi:hypothetical protein
VESIVLGEGDTSKSIGGNAFFSNVGKPTTQSNTTAGFGSLFGAKLDTITQAPVSLIASKPKEDSKPPLSGGLFGSKQSGGLFDSATTTEKSKVPVHLTLRKDISFGEVTSITMSNPNTVASVVPKPTTSGGLDQYAKKKKNETNTAVVMNFKEPTKIIQQNQTSAKEVILGSKEKQSWKEIQTDLDKVEKLKGADKSQKEAFWDQTFSDLKQLTEKANNILGGTRMDPKLEKKPTDHSFVNFNKIHIENNSRDQLRSGVTV